MRSCATLRPQRLCAVAAGGRAGDGIAAQALWAAEAAHQRDQEQGGARHDTEVPWLLLLGGPGTNDSPAPGTAGHRAPEGACTRDDPAYRRAEPRAGLRAPRELSRRMEGLLPVRRDPGRPRRPRQVDSPSPACGAAQALEMRPRHLSGDDRPRYDRPHRPARSCPQRTMVVLVGTRSPSRAAQHSLRQAGGSPPCQVTSTHRTARCGPACRVVWQGTYSPYADYPEQWLWIPGSPSLSDGAPE